MDQLTVLGHLVKTNEATDSDAIFMAPELMDKLQEPWVSLIQQQLKMARTFNDCFNEDGEEHDIKLRNVFIVSALKILGYHQ